MEPGRSPRYALFRAAVEGAVRHPLRLWATVGCLVAVVTPFLVGLAILEGVRAEARVSVDAGPDLVVTGYEHGRNTGLGADLMKHARTLPTVGKVRGRIVGRCYVEDRLLTLVGLDGDGPHPGELWLGASVAAELKLEVGQVLSLTDVGAAELKIVKLVGPEAGLASSRVAVCNLKDAQSVFATPDRISDLQIWVKSDAKTQGDPDLLTSFQLRLTGLPLRIQTRKLVRDYLDRGFTLKGGTFLALYVVALAVCIPALLVTSGFGMSTRRREVALFKLVGFSVLDLLEMAVWEVLALAALAALLSFALAWLWVRVAKGALIAAFFIAELEQGALAAVPALFTPWPLLAAFGLCLVILASGVVVTTWRAASASPAEVLR